MPSFAPWVILAGTIAAALYGLIDQAEKKAEAEAQVASLKGELLEASAETDKLLQEKREAEALTAEAREEKRGVEAEAEGFKREIRRLSYENKELDAYLRSSIHPDVVERMWVRPGSEDGVEICVPTSGADGGDSCTEVAVREVSNEEGWGWCKDVEASLLSCNIDKGKMREWVEKYATEKK